MTPITFFAAGLLTLPLLVLFIRALYPAFFARSILRCMPQVEEERSLQRQQIADLTTLATQRAAQSDYLLKCLDSLGYTLHHLDDESVLTGTPYLWKTKYYVTMGHVLKAVARLRINDGEMLYLLDKPLSYWIEDYQSHLLGGPVKQLLSLIPGFKDKTVYDLIDSLYGLIHAHTEADFDAYLSRYTSIRLPARPMDKMNAEELRWLPG